MHAWTCLCMNICTYALPLIIFIYIPLSCRVPMSLFKELSCAVSVCAVDMSCVRAHAQGVKQMEGFFFIKGKSKKDESFRMVKLLSMVDWHEKRRWMFANSKRSWVLGCYPFSTTKINSPKLILCTKWEALQCFTLLSLFFFFPYSLQHNQMTPYIGLYTIKSSIINTCVNNLTKTLLVNIL